MKMLPVANILGHERLKSPLTQVLEDKDAHPDISAQYWILGYSQCSQVRKGNANHSVEKLTNALTWCT